MKKRILVIDDSQVQLDAAIEQLGDEFEVVTTTSALKARYLLTGIDCFPEGVPEKFDLVMTDIMMPGEDAGQVNIETTKEIATGLAIALICAKKEIPVVMVSNTSHHESPVIWLLDYFYTLGERNIHLSNEGFWKDKVRIKDWRSAVSMVK